MKMLDYESVIILAQNCIVCYEQSDWAKYILTRNNYIIKYHQ